ncbi:hypothetical protein [Catenulispora pinisilvae]|uniref:hypothetical protein n=1 Tax=Catenulispora pinisilvae TaxID=2705253 RepID=UPI001E5B2C20|nr:hypothetical protein [Catenulispora pinisilvae]
METLLEKMTARLAASWARRNEFARRLKEDDRGLVTVDMVLWITGLSVLALTVGSIIYALVVAKAKSIHF